MPGTIDTEKIGKLGFGYMRLPPKGDAFDIEQIKKMADKFIESGGTYFDAAFLYSGAEDALRESVIERYPRDKIHIATKLALHFVEDPTQYKTQFTTSLERLGTDYIDFYLLHGISDERSKMAEEIGVWDFLSQLKSEGRIRHLGFSSHASPEGLDEILSRHPEAEFVQLQINYIDWENEKVQSRRVYEVARKYDMPIVVMEPIKGGLLAGDTSPTAQLLKSANPNASVASWALRFAAQLDGVFVTLSGMSTYEQLLDNVATFSDLKPLSAEERATLDKAIELFNAVPRVACTSCRYCVEGCPSKIPIPMMIDMFNSYLVYRTVANLGEGYRMWTRNGGKACDCTACRACEDVCPQKLEIVDTLAQVSALFDA